MMKFHGYEYRVKVSAWFKVAMAKCEDLDAIDEECFDSLKGLFDDEDITIEGQKIVEVNQLDKHFTTADVEMELEVVLTAYDQDDAYEKAESIIDLSSSDTLPGVKYQGCEAYDYHWNSDKVVDW